MIPTVAIVSDDENFRNTLKSYISTNRKFSVLEPFPSGLALLEKLTEISPKVIVVGDDLDLSPYQFIIEVMEKKPTPCLLATKGVAENEIDLPYALEYGIVDTLLLPSEDDKIIPTNSVFIRLSILSKLNLERFYGQIKAINENQGRKFSLPTPAKLTNQFIDYYPSPRDEKMIADGKIAARSERVKNILVVIGASTGGPSVISAIVSQLPRIFPPTIIIQHMPPGFMEAFASRLDEISKIHVKIAEENEIIKSNVVYICPGGYHLMMEKGSDKLVRFRLSDGPKVNFVKPAVDVTLFSSARVFGNKVISIILSGMGSDGTEGCRVLKSLGGLIWALDESQSVIYGMNKSVVQQGLTDKVLTVEGILTELGKSVYV